MSPITVGTCGYRYWTPDGEWTETYDSKLQAFSDAFDLVELNRTFYSLPRTETAERWRDETVQGFEFTVKAWQAITHPWNSPTWNNHRDATDDDVDTDDLGLLQPSEPVLSAWDETRARAEALDASIVLVQTPPSFDFTDAHEADMREFFSTIDRGEVAVAWEPRGDWSRHPDAIADLCEALDLVHVVDIMREQPVADRSIAYTRLHGRNDEPYDYDYDYSPAELDALADKLGRLAETHDDVYCLFNNYAMFENARHLERVLGG